MPDEHSRASILQCHHTLLDALLAALGRVILLALALGGLARAADRTQIVQQGFSPGGRYHLLLTSLVRDGSGFPSAALQITDVRYNRIVARRERVWREMEGNALPRLLTDWRGTQAPLLGRYGLNHPAPGELLFQLHPLPGAEYPGNSPSSAATRVGPLTLSSLPLGSGCRSSEHLTRGLVLRLGTRELQRDRRLPASRACALGYRLETAWYYRGSLAVIVRVYSPGFEGPDALPLVVTGELGGRGQP